MMLLRVLTLLAFTVVALAKHRDNKNYNKDKDVTEVAKSTDYLVFSITADDFQARRKTRDGAAGLDWAANGCNHSPDKPFGWDFKNSCDRHDFAYRNYKAQGRFSSPNKKKIDRKFKQDMLDQCKVENGSKSACRTLAKTYYRAVRIFSRKRSLAGRLDMASLAEEGDDEDWEDEEVGEDWEDEEVGEVSVGADGADLEVV